MSSKNEAVKKLPEGVRPEDLIPDPNMSEEERARRKRFAEKLLALQGKIHIDLDIDEIRGRNRS
ncbi:MAG TPA: hypothetical protein VII75_11570 [Thermoanaerobaculia bacterium]